MLMRKSRVISLLAVVLLAGFAGGLDARAASVTISLASPTVTAASAVFDVNLSFEGNPGDILNAVQFSVVGSDPLLTAGGTDYSRFSFQLNTAAVPGWIELAPISPTSGFDLNAPNDSVNGPFLTPTGGLLLGTLAVNLAGIAPGTSLFVTLAGGTPGSDATDASGVIGGTDVLSLASAGLLTATPAQVTFQAVSEPASLALAVPPVLLALALTLRRIGRSGLHRVHKSVPSRGTY